jgi:hypothetical protein
VLSVLGFLAADGLEVESDVNVKATPACLCHFEGRVLACSKGVLVGIEYFELNFIEPGSNIRIAFGLPYVYSPALRVVVGNALGPRGVAEGREIVSF